LEADYPGEPSEPFPVCLKGYKRDDGGDLPASGSESPDEMPVEARRVSHSIQNREPVLGIDFKRNYPTAMALVRCRAPAQAIGAAPWDEARWKEFLATPAYRKLFLEEVDVTQSPFTERYPELVGFLDEEGGLRMNYAAGNVAVRCKNFIEGNWEIDRCLVTEEDPGFVDYRNRDFTLREDSEVFQRIPDFEPIPFGEIGLYEDAFRSRP
jgi:hypothetical protein